MHDGPTVTMTRSGRCAGVMVIPRLGRAIDMRSWILRRSGASDLRIYGATLHEAVCESFSQFARYYDVGTAAGYELVSVRLEPTDSGAGAALYIRARGVDLDEVRGEVTLTRIAVAGLRPGDLAEAMDLVPKGAGQ